MNQDNNHNKFSDNKLNQRLKLLVVSERKLSSEILELICLVERRRLHLDMGYSSVFEYLTQFLGYNESSAYRRMQAARLLNEVPEVKKSLQAGKLHLTQLAQLQTAIKSEQKQSRKIISQHAKVTILNKLENKTFLETQRILTTELPSYKLEAPKAIQHKNDESVYVTLHLTKEQYETIMQAKDLLSHISNGKIEEVIVNLCKKEIQNKTVLTKKDIVLDKNPELIAAEILVLNTKKSLLTTEKSSLLPVLKLQAKRLQKRQAIAVATKRKIFSNNRCCQYVHQTTGKKCGSTFQLQLDHKQSVWAGGGNDTANLQLLCAAHNRRKYELEMGG